MVKDISVDIVEIKLMTAITIEITASHIDLVVIFLEIIFMLLSLH